MDLSLKYIFGVKPLGISDGIISTNNFGLKFNNNNVEGKKIFGTQVFTNNEGFRVVKNYLPKDKSLEKIYFIGGSVTFGSGVKQEHTFSGLLNSKYKKYNIFNASVMGSDLKNNYLILEKISKKDKIKKVFINFSFDDVENVKIENFDINSNKKENFYLLDKLKEIDLFKKLNTFFRSRSVTYVYIKGFLLNTREYYYQNALNTYTDRESINIIDETFKKIKMINDSKTEVIFIKIPYYSQISEKNCKKKDLGEIKILEKLRNNQFKFIDFKPIFCSMNNRNKIFLSFDASHLSKFGHKIIADNLDKFLD